MGKTVSFVLLVVALVVCSGVPAAWSQESTANNAQLMDVIQKLEKRVAELETKLGETQNVDARLQEVEKKVEISAEKTLGPNDFRVYWKDGVRFETQDKSMQFRVGGRIQHDFYTGDIDNGDFDDGTRFRRAWVYLRGVMYDDIEFKLQYGIEKNGAAKFKDAYIAYSGLDFMDITVGQFKEPFSLDELTSSNYMSMMERTSLAALAPSRQTGIMLSNSVFNDRMTWAAGWFKTANDFGDGDDNDGDGDWDVALRLTGLPLYEEEGAKLVHLGAGYVHREWGEDPYEISSRGSYSTGSELVNYSGEYDGETLSVIADSIDQFGAEAALVLGPFAAQAEYAFANVQGSDDFEDSHIHAAYAELSYFITGEHRAYDPEAGIFTRTKPKNNFMKDGGLGAWQVALRYAYLNLEDTPIDDNFITEDELYTSAIGGVVHDFVVGLNWYLNPNMRIMLNYVHSMNEEVPDYADMDADIVQARLQIDF